MVVMSKRIRTIPPPPLSEYYKIAMELEKKGIEIIDFGQCGTDIYLPTEILTKFKKLLSERQLYEYSRPEGLPEVREAVSIKLREDNNVEYSPFIKAIGNKCLVYNYYVGYSKIVLTRVGN